MATQSSQHSAYGPWGAFDNKTDHVLGVHTLDYGETSPWFQVDLGKSEEITTVVWHNRNCNKECASRNNGANLYVDNTLCASNIEMVQAAEQRIPCYTTGRVIRLVLPGENRIMQFDELEINVAQRPDANREYKSRPVAEESALRHTLKLLALAPDFHATNLHQTKKVERPPPPLQVSKNRKYKAVIVVFLEGGADSFNIVVPHSDCQKPKVPVEGADPADIETEAHDLYGEYVLERGQAEALKKAELLKVDIPDNGQPCKTCTMLVFPQNFSAPRAIGSYDCWLEVSMHVIQ
jgi:hypothetical protein